MSEIGEIRVAAYVAGGFIPADSGYAPTLRGLGADGTGHVLVATDAANEIPASERQAGDGQPSETRPNASQADNERIIGTIMLQRWPHAGQVVTGPHEAEIRALAVRPEVQGLGVGRKLLRHLLDLAAGEGIRHLVLCTEPTMRTAHRLYEQEGFVRLPGRDWSPAPGITLLVYGLHLNGAVPASR